MAAIVASNFAVAARPTVARKLSSKKASLPGAFRRRASRPRVDFSCKLHPPKRTVGYRLKPSGPWWPVTRGNARVVDRLADLTPPSPFQTAVKRVQAVKAVSVKAVAR